MTGRDWRKRAEADFEFARKVLLEVGKVSPMYIVHGAERVVPVYCGQFPKADQRKIMRLICIAERAEAIAMIGEAWTARAKRGEEHLPASHIVPPSEREDRIEVVMVSMTWREDGERRTVMRVGEIVRDAAGKAVELKAEPVSGAADEFAGPATEILPERMPDAFAVKAAREMLEAVSDYGNVGKKPH
jgi:hypothetical protein